MRGYVMASERSHPTAADYVTLVLSPALIMALVGSLVFFLLEVFYAGEYEFRLQWILFFFVFAAVLIARLTVTGVSHLPPTAYALVLGVLVFIGMCLFVDYPDDFPLKPVAPAINFVLLAVTWFCAHRLTWDCTHIDDKVEATNEGLLQAAGLEEVPPEQQAANEEKAEVAEALAEEKPDDSTPPRKLDW